ncbi:MAG: hypothetical protein AB1489_36735 [Acidobacteriota bacterium]
MSKLARLALRLPSELEKVRRENTQRKERLDRRNWLSKTVGQNTEPRGFMEDSAGISYNGTMPVEKAQQMEQLPAVDILQLCKTIEKLKGYNQRQMSELLGVHLRTYQSWRFAVDRDPSGNAIARLFLLKEQIEQEFGIKIPLTTKPQKQ